MILEVEHLSKRFGGLAAVNDLGFSVEEEEIFAIIGPNGAGKTTTLNMISGLMPPSGGSLTLEGRDITRLSSAERCHLGLGRAFQVVRPFPGMTVLENVLVGALFGTPGTSRRQGRRYAREALEQTGLSEMQDTPVEELTLLQEKRLEIARALATRPKLLLLDEVMAGLRPAEAKEAVALVRRLRDRGITIAFIEHLMPVVRELADRVMVMDYGSKIAEGSYREVTSDPRVIEAYLGKDEGGAES